LKVISEAKEIALEDKLPRKGERRGRLSPKDLSCTVNRQNIL
jgi:hypothetical protein